MRLLLDTHTLLWYTLGDPQLSESARNLILESANEILVSPASYWEIAIKVSIGKLTLHHPYREFVEVCQNRYGFGILPIEPRHTARVAELPFSSGHKDPFDRMLASQAFVEDIPIISADTALDQYGATRLW